MSKTINKKILKEGYYWEFKDFYDDLPDKLPVPKKTYSKVLTEDTTEEEMVKWGEPFTKKEAFGLAGEIIKENDEKYKYNLIWFEDNGALCELSVWLDGDGWWVSVDEFNAPNGWHAGYRSFFRNKNSDTLKLENFIKDLKEVIKRYE